MRKDARIFVAGHRGLVGSALVRRLEAEGHSDLVVKTRAQLDLANQAEVLNFFVEEQPEYVFLAAAKVGGILANSRYPGDFVLENLQIQTNVVQAAWKTGVKRLLFLGSSCIYPREAEQPISEDALLSGPLEKTNEWYAVAKIAGIKLCQGLGRQYGFESVCAMPTNLYGPGDNFHPENSHVIPGLIRRFHEAKASGEKDVVVWGTGRPLREFLYVDDLADALVFLMRNHSGEELVNVGAGDEISILHLAQLIGDVVGFNGEVRFERPEMDGTPRKLLDSTRMQRLGWRPSHSLEQGLEKTYSWFLESEK